MTLLAALLAPALAAEMPLPVPSPRASVSQEVGTVTVTVDYASPAVRDRTVFGELVPFGELWRTGANAATTLETTGPITLGGQALEAGRYALFSIPGETSWTIIVNGNPDQGGTGSYDEGEDVARFEVTPMSVSGRERLTFLFEDTTMTTSALRLEWADTAVVLPIEVDSMGRADAAIDTYLARTARELANAARFQHERGEHATARDLLERSLAVQETWFATWIQANVLKALGEGKLAYRALKRADELGKRDGGYFYADRVEEALATWPKR
jgi:hypothetical protein